MFDRDGDGYLSKAEIKQVLSGMVILYDIQGYSIDGLADYCFNSINKKLDNKLTKEEFISALEKDYGLRSIMSPFQ